MCFGPGWEFRRPGSREKRMGYFSWLVSCRLIRLNPGAWWGREECLAQRLGRGICAESVLDCGSRKNSTVKFSL